MGNPQVTQDIKIPQNLFLQYLQLNNLIGSNAKPISQRSKVREASKIRTDSHIFVRITTDP